MPRRIFWFILLVWSVVVLPWWVSLLLMVLLTFHYRNFYEVIVAAMIFDLLYGAQGVGWFGFQFSTTVVMFTLILLAAVVRTDLVWRTL